MTPLLWTGSAALGIVWGWWSVPQSERRPKTAAALLITLAALAQAAVNVWFAGYTSAAMFVGCWAFGLLLHSAFRNALRDRLRERPTT